MINYDKLNISDIASYIYITSPWHAAGTSVVSKLRIVLSPRISANIRWTKRHLESPAPNRGLHTYIYIQDYTGMSICHSTIIIGQCIYIYVYGEHISTEAYHILIHILWQIHTHTDMYIYIYVHMLGDNSAIINYSILYISPSPFIIVYNCLYISPCPFIHVS
jgi:hypothetical protein